VTAMPRAANPFFILLSALLIAFPVAAETATAIVGVWRADIAAFEEKVHRLVDQAVSQLPVDRRAEAEPRIRAKGEEFALMIAREVGDSIEFTPNGKVVISYGDGRPDLVARWRAVGEEVIVDHQDAGKQSFPWKATFSGERLKFVPVSVGDPESRDFWTIELVRR